MYSSTINIGKKLFIFLIIGILFLLYFVAALFAALADRQAIDIGNGDIDAPSLGASLGHRLLHPFTSPVPPPAPVVYDEQTCAAVLKAVEEKREQMVEEKAREGAVPYVKSR